jgi:DNA polymerase delta subunit 1
MSIEFQVVSWDARDHPDGKFLVHMFGRTLDGKSVHVAVRFKPYFFVKGRYPNRPIVKRKDLWGFQNLQEHVFSMFEFDTLEEFRDEQRKFKNGLYEANIDPLLRFMHRTGVKSTGWASVPSTLENAYMSSHSDIDVYADEWSVVKSIDLDDKSAPFLISSLDIECFSKSGQFPDSMKPEDVCFQIAITTKQNGEYVDRRVFGVKTEFKTEKEMLEAFVRYMRKLNPDVVTGWNIYGFDLEYIYNRMVSCGCSDYVLGRLDDENIKLTIKNLSSNALGNNTLKMVKMTGRYVFDMYQEIKREHKFESYSLNNVSKILLGDQKLDMPVKEIFKRYATGEGLEEVAEYCVKDTELPHAISEKLSLFQNLVEMAKVCWVPLNFLSERGQQIKVFSQLAYTARELGFMIPTIRIRANPEEAHGYQGATVLEAQTGAYYEPITALDFASLYPSIMCAHNLCYSTLVMDKRFLDIPGVVYERFGPHVFALEKDGQRVSSLLPVILERLKVYRKESKKKMEEFPELYNVYNGKQLAYKISMNSVYGFTGAVTKGILPCMPIAETVTFRGRQMIEQSKEYVEANFTGAKVRYGDTDSIMVQFDTEGRTGIDAIEYSWKLGERASKEISALFRSPNKLELEKVYCPYFLYSKKRYAAKMWTEKKGKVTFEKIDVKGLQVVRRDSCKFVRDTCKKLLETILETSDPTTAIKLARDAKEDLIGGRVQATDLVLTKSLADSYKVQMPHVEVVKKMRERNPGSEPQIGSRVPFVIIKNKYERMFEKAEDPVWASEKNIPIDYTYYFEHQLKKPVEDLLEPLLDPTEIFATSKKNRKITEFFLKK